MKHSLCRFQSCLNPLLAARYPRLATLQVEDLVRSVLLSYAQSEDVRNKNLTDAKARSIGRAYLA